MIMRSMAYGNAMLMDMLMQDYEDARVTPRAQVGALVWRIEKSVLQVLLVNSRDTGRFVIPKGWTETKFSDPEAAANEAYEEAGIQGIIASKPIGRFSYTKIIGPGFALPCVITVFSMEAVTLLSTWPEAHERTRFWMTLDQAAASVDEPELKLLIEDFVPVL
jgi:8-oxo-dGTP pyrophosphatase MutT (NUDIX family)